MIKAIVCGVLFVGLCIGIPSVLGLLASDFSILKQYEQRTNILTINDDKENEPMTENVTIDSEPNSIETSTISEDEALAILSSEFTLTELIDIYQKVRSDNVSKEDTEEIMALVEKRLSEEEVQALVQYGLGKFKQFTE